jgi:predicted RNA-binding Zn ribbon-like protein
MDGTARPPHVDLLVAFTNSLDVTEGTDEITTPAELGRWLHAHGLTAREPRAEPADLDLALRLRAGLHAALVGHHDGVESGEAFAATSADLPLRIVLAADGPRLEPVEAGVRGALARLAVAVADAAADGTWPRLKICAAGDCSWAFYDASKNRSRSWCEWGCGNKIKTRNYRSRQRAAAGG